MEGHYNFDSATAGSLSPHSPVAPAYPPRSRTVRGKTSGYSAVARVIVDANVSGLRESVDYDPSGEARKFERLARKWKKQTMFMSAIDDMAMNEQYQQIIGMGSSTIPFILKKLKTEPDFWFWALQAITRTNPVRKNDIGNLEKMTAAWLKWGRANGYSV